MTAKSATVQVEPDRAFSISLTGAQIALVLDVIREAHFKGHQCDLAASCIRAIQEPVLQHVHGAKT